MTAFTDQQLQDIQGFGLGGFRKDSQESLFIKIGTPDGGKTFLRWLTPHVANAWEVDRFNRVFSEVRRRTGDESVKATWTGVMISAAGYAALGVPLADLPTGESNSAFAAGMANRSTQIGDVQPGDVPASWLAPFQPNANEVHIAVIVASDDACDLDAHLVSIYQKAVETGCTVVFHERGATLPIPHTGHEHFGFKDGISQPAIDGFDDPPAPNEPSVVAAGEIVLGYPDAGGATVGTGTVWENGSFVVFRRLTQDVMGFRTLASAGVPGSDPAVPQDLLAAKMIGRWPSGAPIEQFPDADPGLGNESNAFGFGTDADGHACPVWAHIRKTNPRDETTPGGATDDPTRHRMLRRGIPFGPPLPGAATADDGATRGLHFFCVIADIDRQFEFIQRNWMNNPNFPIGGVPAQPGGQYTPPTPGTLAGGPDPVVGEHDGSAQCVFQQASGQHPFPVATEVVHVTAGEYFFLPALSALTKIAG